MSHFHTINAHSTLAHPSLFTEEKFFLIKLLQLRELYLIDQISQIVSLIQERLFNFLKQFLIPHLKQFE